MKQQIEFNTEAAENQEIEIDLLDLFAYYRSRIVWIMNPAFVQYT